MNPMKYYVDADGNYLGGWDANPSDGAIEVPFPPDDARQVWIDGEWGEVPEPELDPLRNLEPDQFHTMLNLSGYREDIEALAAASDDPLFVATTKARLAHAKHFVRNDPLIVGIAQAIGLEPEMLDQMWAQAHNF